MGQLSHLSPRADPHLYTYLACCRCCRTSRMKRMTCSENVKIVVAGQRRRRRVVGKEKVYGEERRVAWQTHRDQGRRFSLLSIHRTDGLGELASSLCQDDTHGWRLTMPVNTTVSLLFFFSFSPHLFLDLSANVMLGWVPTSFADGADGADASMYTICTVRTV